MALADIVQRIERDGVAEAQAVVSEAQDRADALVKDAREQAEKARTLALAQAERRSRAEAETLLATVRLEVRDRALTARRELVDGALAGARDAVLALGDGAYADLLARRIVAAARGGEAVLVAGADAPRIADRLPGAVERAGGGGLNLTWSNDPAPVENGVILQGDRVSVDLSIDSVIEGRRDELAMLAAEALFNGVGD
jgi:vacuolar-type H+-ATPase subunit E/Vma4